MHGLKGAEGERKTAERSAGLGSVTMIEKIIFVAVALFVEAAILPGALEAIATAALTSVNAAVITLWQVLVPIMAVVATVLAFVRSIRG